MPVYFIQRGNDGPVKIGFAADIAGRVASLQTGCPEKLVVLAALGGSAHTEKSIHREFADARLGGEWFSPTARLMTFVRSLPEDAGHDPELPGESGVRSVFCRWPTIAELAADIGAPLARVSKWWQRNSLPAPYMAAVLEAARRRGWSDITAELLVSLADIRENGEAA